MSASRSIPGLSFALIATVLLGPGMSRVSAQRKRFPFPPEKLEEDRGRYPAVPFRPGDVESLFKQQMERARDLDVARSFLDQIMKNQAALPPGFDPDDPRLLELIGPLVKDLGIKKKLEEMSPDELDRLKTKLESLRGDKEKLLDALPDGKAPADPRSVGPPSQDEPAAGASWMTEEGLSEMVRDWLEGLDETRVGDWLRDSPAWQNTLSELQRHLNDARLEPPGWSLDFDVLQGGIERLRSVPPPTFPGLSLPAFQMGRVPVPSLGRPSVGGVSSPSADVLLWLAITGLLLGVAWLVLVQLRRRRSIPPIRELGPWPVDPARVATRIQLRIAFEHLALLALGTDARTWNHRRVAAALGQDDLRAEAARRLARLYEQARYTDGPDDLDPEEAEQARASLTLFLEASR